LCNCSGAFDAAGDEFNAIAKRSTRQIRKKERPSPPFFPDLE
jgi:hypothetical protein